VAKGPALQLATVRVERVTAGARSWRVRTPVLVFAHGGGWSGLLPSTTLTLKGHLQPPQPGDSVAAVLQAQGLPVVTGGPSLVQRVAGRLRGGLRRSSATLPGGADGLLPGLVIGDTSRLSDADKADFRADGLTHPE
jgi:competence protein ComEC